MSTTSIQALRERVSALRKEARNLVENQGSGVWTTEQQTKFDNMAAEIDRGEAQIKSMQRVMDQEAEDNFRDAGNRSGGEGGPGAKNTVTKGLEVFLRKGFTNLTAEEMHAVRNTMSTTTGSEGGYTVQPQVATSFIDLIKAYGFMRKVADRLVTTTGVDLSYPTTDGTSESGEILAQNATAAAADLTFGTRPLNTVKFSSKSFGVPIELLQDTQIDVVGLVWKRARDRIGRVQNLKYTVGSGTGEPNGLVTAASVGKTGATGQTLTVLYDDLVDMVDSLDAGYLDNENADPSAPNIETGWMFSQTTRRVVRKLKDSNGRPLWIPSWDEGATGKTPDRLLGYPVYLNNDMASPAANAKSIAFGNFNKYLIRDTADVMMLRFDDSNFMLKGQVGFLVLQRGGGNLMDVNSVKLYQHSAT